MSNDNSNTSVQVALRIRPLVESEISRSCRNVIDVITELHQVHIKDTEKAFTFNHVFDCDAKQDEIYNKCIGKLIENLFKGYNVTILAYGQTGSGKTFTMGTSYTGEENTGVIPRAVRDIFAYVRDCFTFDFNITVSFIELYQETCYDLLSSKTREQCVMEIREDNRSVIIPGLTEEPVKSASDALEYLVKGSEGRATGSTNMNAQSSRSHAIFTINISMQNKENSSINRTAKFHLVDLAGSERPKKTGATGQTFREGVNINKGLLVLGNVISALGDEKQHSYIPYRDSNLTRLLKDSLGGNSITLMIACVSPADYNLEETLSTLRYADRAKKIKNKPIVNQDEKTAEINRLNKQIRQLRLELIGQGGAAVSQSELEQIKRENEDLKSKNRHLTVTLSSTIHEKMSLLEKVTMMQTAKENVHSKIIQLNSEYNETLNNLNKSIEVNNINEIRMNFLKLQNIQVEITNIDTEQKKNDDELRLFEATSDKIFSTTPNNDVVTESEISERQESHTAQQIALNIELQEITKQLAMKEHLAQQIANNACLMVDYEAIEEDKSKISSLEKEKHDLMQQLKNFQTSGVCSKIAEQRRKRVRELENQILDLKRRVQEQARLIKLKERDEQKITQLRTEISSMKQAKVKLIKSMRQESEKFRVWKIQRERQINKLKEQDRKKQNLIVKMETMHNRQQNVLKRKVEEAAALNKRLKDALALRKAAQESKSTIKEDRLGHWLKQEWEIFVSTIEARLMLKNLLTNREILQNELDRLRGNDLDGPETVEEQQIKDEIEMNCAQITSLQQKLLDSDEEHRFKTRWDHIQSMSEAKYCLKTLFSYIDDVLKERYATHSRCQELQDINQKLKEENLQIKSIETTYYDEIAQLKKEYEEKTSVLLRQLRGVEVKNDNEEIRNRCIIQQETIENLEKQNAILIEENEQFKCKIETINDVATEKRTPGGVTLRRTTKKIYDQLDIIDGSPLIDNTITDPDWHFKWNKTPLGQRVSRMKESEENQGAVKRNSEGGCACKGNCNIRRCGCKKLMNYCSGLCKCNSMTCINRESAKENSYSLSEENVQFKVPMPVEDDKKTRDLKRTKLFD